MNIYIAGDSFCFYRDDKHNHWPAILADSLDLALKGKGFPGQSWWALRQNLLEYAKTSDFADTKFFVLCHPEPYRMTVDDQIDPSEMQRIQSTYLKYFLNTEICDWIMLHWFRELNAMLEGKTVLHIQCFETSTKYFHLLRGYKYLNPLKLESLAEVNHNLSHFLLDKRCNHFSPEGNQRLAKRFLELIN